MASINDNSKESKAESLALELLKLARDTITVRFRYFDTALGRIKTRVKKDLGAIYTDGDTMYFDPELLLSLYMDEPHIAVRAYLHMLLHCIFFHRFRYDMVNEKYWDLATDIAVENIILDMNFQGAALSRDTDEADKIERLKKRVPSMTAEKLYKEFLMSKPSFEYEAELNRLFSLDYHAVWREAEEETIIITNEQWKKISERIKTELKAFDKHKSGTESLENNLEEATRQRYNYREILEQFTVSGEEMTVNDDEFDYIYYTYGLSVYGNLPLVEPLEYKEVNKVREFVIAIDTSASCRGEIVKQFIQRTYEILKGTENFFREINVHIIQCDSEIQSDVKIKDENDFERFIKNEKLQGFGATDFNPVFEYVDKLREKGEFKNLKGLIYFTDGYGIYPEKMPDYDVIFAFLEEDANRQPVPGWALKVILEDELSEY